MQKPELIIEIIADGGSIKFYRKTKNHKDVFFLITHENYFNNEAPEYTESGIYLDLKELITETVKLYPVFMLYPTFIHESYKNTFSAYLTEYALSKGINLDTWCKALQNNK